MILVTSPTKRFDLACIAAHPARRGDNAGLYIGLECPALARARGQWLGWGWALGRWWDNDFRVHSAGIHATRHAVLLHRLQLAEVLEDLVPVRHLRDDLVHLGHVRVLVQDLDANEALKRLLTRLCNKPPAPPPRPNRRRASP